LNGSEVVSAAPTAATKVGNWYLLNLETDVINGFTSFEVGVKSATGTVLFDDFRFQPVDAAMTCYVSNPLNFQHTAGQNIFEYVLDNYNLFTKYEYDERGALVRTYQESLKYGVKLITESRQNYKRTHVNQ
jgi:hypothetical protein